MGTLARIGDPRALQYWDDARALSDTMVAGLEGDTLPSVAQIERTGTIVWDCAAVFRAGRRWDERFPVPDWSGRPVADMADTLARRLRAIEGLAPASKP